MGNLETVQRIYEAFGKGDIPAIVDKLAEDVEWEFAYRKTPHGVPWLQPRNGKAEAPGFFQVLGSDVEFHYLNFKELLEGPGVVVALVDLELLVKKTGKVVIEQDEVHVWRFNDAGKVVRFRHCADTLQHAQACQS